MDRDRRRRRAAAVPDHPGQLRAVAGEAARAHRRLHQVQDGSPTKKGDVICLTNVMKMPTGRMWDDSTRFSPDPKYKIPMMKIVIGDDAPDN